MHHDGQLLHQLKTNTSHDMHEHRRQPNKLSSHSKSKYYATPDCADENDCSRIIDGQPNALAHATHSWKAGQHGD